MINNLIAGHAYFLSNLPKVLIDCEPEASPEVRITELTSGTTLFHGKLWPNFQGELEIDLKPLIKDFFQPKFPNPRRDTAFYTKNFVHLKIEDLEYDYDATIYVNLFSGDSLNYMSDIDEMAIPASDYDLPISWPNEPGLAVAKIISQKGEDDSLGHVLQYASLEPRRGRNNAMLSSVYQDSSSPFYIYIPYDGDDCCSPVYHVEPGEYEQYLFYNRHGSWDNVAMRGRRTICPEMDFSTARQSGLWVKGDSEVIKKYTQDSGYMSKKTIAALMLLMESPCIYHRRYGTWQKIVIDECTPSLNSDDTLHSLSFTYRYSEDSETYEI